MISDILLRLLLGVIVFVVMPSVSLIIACIAIDNAVHKEYGESFIATLFTVLFWLLTALAIALFLGV